MELLLVLYTDGNSFGRDLNIRLKWGSEYRKHLNTKLFQVRISNGRFMCYILCTNGLFKFRTSIKKTRWRTFVWYSNGLAVPYSNSI